MKADRLNALLKKMIPGIFAILIVLSFDSCTKKVAFLNSAVVPAARGYVSVRKDKNKNYIIKIELADLAEAERLQPPKQTYIVWMVTEDGNTKNLGRLNSSVSLLAKKLKASFKSVSAFKPIKIFITAENDANIQYPGDQVIITTDNF